MQWLNNLGRVADSDRRTRQDHPGEGIERFVFSAHTAGCSSSAPRIDQLRRGALPRGSTAASCAARRWGLNVDYLIMNLSDPYSGLFESSRAPIERILKDIGNAPPAVVSSAQTGLSFRATIQARKGRLSYRYVQDARRADGGRRGTTRIWGSPAGWSRREADIAGRAADAKWASGPKEASRRTGVRVEAEVPTRTRIECLLAKPKLPESLVVCASVNGDMWFHLAFQASPRHADLD